MHNIILDTRGKRQYSVCDFHRIILPYKRNLDINPNHDIFIFNGVPTKGKPGFLSLKNLGFKIVMDVDDSLQMPEGHMLKALFDKGIRNDMKWFMERSDLITTTTKELQKEFSQYNDNVHVVPNGLPFDEDQFTATRDRYSKSPLVWAGSETHRDDLGILPEFGKSLTLCGFRKDSEKVSSDEWTQIKNIIQPSVVYENIRPYDKYMESYDGHQIALAPLVLNKFNNSKSNLKVLEAGAKQIPIICSRTNNYYNDGLRDYVFYADSKREWKDLSEYLIENPDLCAEKGIALGEYVRENYHIDKINDIRRTLIEKL